MKLPHPPKVLIGIDPSLTGMAAVVLEEQTTKPLLLRTYGTPSDLSDLVRTSWLADKLLHDLDEYLCVPCLVSIEGYSMGSRQQGKVYARAELCGIVKYSINAIYQRPIFIVAPTSVKSFLGAVTPRGARTAKEKKEKPEVQQALLSMFDFYHPSPDIRDAYAICRYGHSAYRNSSSNLKGTLELPIRSPLQALAKIVSA